MNSENGNPKALQEARKRQRLTSLVLRDQPCDSDGSGIKDQRLQLEEDVLLEERHEKSGESRHVEENNSMEKNTSSATDVQRAVSADLESHIQEIKQKMDNFTEKVSGLLQAVKTYFEEAAKVFEENIVSFHQAQIEKWEEDIRQLGTVDIENEEMNIRLTNAQILLKDHISILQSISS